MYSRELEGQTYTFGVSGKLWRDALLMYDSGTQSLWTHITGEAIRGPLKGKRLKMLAAMPQIAWKTWRKNYPETRVLSVRASESKARDVYADYHASQRAGVSGMDYTDERLPDKSLVIGVQVAARYRAYPLTLFAETAFLNDNVGGVPLLIFHDKDSFATAVFARSLGDTVLTFESQNGYFVEDDTGTLWNLVTGESEGARLKRLPAVNIYWFAWARYHPETSIYVPKVD